MMRWPAILILAMLLAGGSDDATPPSSAPARAVTFMPLYVYIDPHGSPLACYQVEVTVASGDATVTGIEGMEGGKSPGFGDAPYYDDRAMKTGRIIFGAFDTGSTLPTGNTAMAILSFEVTGSATPQFQATLQVAAGSDGKPINATVTVSSTPPHAAPIARDHNGAPRSVARRDDTACECPTGLRSPKSGFSASLGELPSVPNRSTPSAERYGVFRSSGTSREPSRTYAAVVESQRFEWQQR